MQDNDFSTKDKLISRRTFGLLLTGGLVSLLLVGCGRRGSLRLPRPGEGTSFSDPSPTSGNDK